MNFINVDFLKGYGGLFKTPVPGQQMLAATLGVSVLVMDTASEGGAWGNGGAGLFYERKGEEQSFGKYLLEKIFSGQPGTAIAPREADRKGFNKFMESYVRALILREAGIGVCWKR